MVTWASADVSTTSRGQIFKISFRQYLCPGENRTLKMVTWASADVTARRHVVRFSKIFFYFQKFLFCFCQYRFWRSRTLKWSRGHLLTTLKMVTWASADVTARRHVVRFSKFFSFSVNIFAWRK
ncbi:hypothetical protein PUN28_020387 [Cardiocondyla obscurior]|uniref:Uncharacterized protein n=1 Tax=Cardiocondyla obscurior TaxID=286306 RepID=A0AAW2E844_9HYME